MVCTLLPQLVMMIIITINTMPSCTSAVSICVKTENTSFGDFNISAACNNTFTTLLDALEYSHAVQNLSLDEPTAIILTDGQYELPSTAYSNFERINGFSIVGSSEGSTVISCNPAASGGLSFIASQRISLRDMIFTGCGQKHVSTSRNFHTRNFSFVEFQSTLYFEQCRDVTLNTISVTNSYGIAAQFYATTGMNVIYNSTFSSNNKSVENGGGVAIEFPYCFPGDTTCNDSASSVPLDVISNGTFDISESKFEANTATNADTLVSSYSYPNHISHHAFGRGGGLSVFFKGRALNNNVNVSKSYFKENAALFGGGLFIQFEDASSDNFVSIKECTFDGNSAEEKGGGAVVNFLRYGDQQIQNNVVEFYVSLFVDNEASHGGGLSLYATREANHTRPTNTLYLVKTNFTKNEAHFGSAVDLSLWRLFHTGAKIEPVFDDCTFTNNRIHYEQDGVVGSAALDLDIVPIMFRNHVSFESNLGTGIVARSAVVTFSSNCQALFRSNTGNYGGAITLIEQSTMIVGERTRFAFENNTSWHKGGALHAAFAAEHDSIDSYNCFLQYIDPTLHPDFWETNFTFDGNKQLDGRSNAIYATSILPCLWDMDDEITDDSPLKTSVFCWNCSGNTWNYKPSPICHDNIVTAPANFGIGMQTFDVSLIPGQLTLLELNASDDVGNNVTDDLIFSISSKEIRVDESNRIVSNSKILLLQENETSGHLLLESEGDRPIGALINISFTSCPLGFKLVEGSCDNCAGNFKGYVECSSDFHLKVQQGYWIGLSPKDNSTTVVGLCKYCNMTATDDDSFVIISTNTFPQETAISSQCQKNRAGTLCSQCVANFSPAVNTESFECVECPGIDPLGVFYFILDFIFTTILYLFLLFTNFKLTSGPFTGVILFAQLITTALGDLDTFTANIVRSQAWAKVLKSIYEIPYGIWNLQFWIPEVAPRCIAPGLSSADVLALNYITALYPFILVLLSLSLVTASVRFSFYDNLKKQLRRWMRPLYNRLDRYQQNMEERLAQQNTTWNKVANERIRNAFASAVLLTYTKIALVTCYLLAPTPLWEANDDYFPHMYVLYIDGQYSPYEYQYIVPALLFAILILIIPLFLLLFTHVNQEPQTAHPRYVNHLLRACQEDLKHSITNTGSHSCQKFWNIKLRHPKTLREDLSWMSGVYFYFRLVMLLVFSLAWNFAIQSTIQSIFCIIMAMIVMVVQPYKKEWINKLDGCVFLLMAIITSLNVYQYYNIISDTGYSEWAFSLQYILILLPLAYLVVYFVLFVIKHCKRKNQNDDENAHELDYYLIQ